MATTIAKNGTKPGAHNDYAATAESAKTLYLEPLRDETIIVPIVGLSPLIPGAWSEKARAMMASAQSGAKTRQKKEPKDPVTEAEGRTYRMPDGSFAMPSVNFKAAIVDAARFFDGLTMTNAKRAFFVTGEGADQLIRLEVGEAVIREDMVRNATGVADIRYRYALWPWRANLTVTFLTSLIDRQSLVNLVDASGRVGVGEWRPSAPKSSTGTFGMYAVDRDREIKVGR